MWSLMAVREIITDLANMMADHLQRYRAKTGTLPKKVLMFRDGVSEGQYKQVVE